MNTFKIIGALASSIALGACATTPGGPAAGAARAPGSPVGLLVQIQDLQAEVRSLRDQVEILQHEQGSVQQRQRQLYDDLDRRLRSRERTTGLATGLPGTGPGLPGAGVSRNPTPPAAANGEPGEREAYEQAFDMLKQSRYSDAVAAFASFLRSYPDGAYAASAQYWIAEAHYVNRDYAKALAQFRTVVQRFGSSAKAPDAWLKMGYTQFELGRDAAARATLQELIRRFPGTRVATAAQNRLRQR